MYMETEEAATRMAEDGITHHIDERDPKTVTGKNRAIKL